MEEKICDICGEPIYDPFNNIIEMDLGKSYVYLHYKVCSWECFDAAIAQFKAEKIRIEKDSSRHKGVIGLLRRLKG